MSPIAATDSWCATVQPACLGDKMSGLFVLSFFLKSSLEVCKLVHDGTWQLSCNFTQSMGYFYCRQRSCIAWCNRQDANLMLSHSRLCTRLIPRRKIHLMPRRFFWTCERLELVSESKLAVLSSVLESTVHNWNDDFWQNTNAWRSSLGFFHPQFSSKSTATFLTLRHDRSDKSGPFFHCVICYLLSVDIAHWYSEFHEENTLFIQFFLLQVLQDWHETH